MVSNSVIITQFETKYWHFYTQYVRKYIPIGYCYTPFQSCKTPAFALHNFLYKQCLSYICMKWTFYVYEHKYVRCKSMQMFKKRYVIYHYNRDRHFKNIVNSTRLISFCISHHHLLLFPFSDYGGQLYYDSRCDLVD